MAPTVKGFDGMTLTGTRKHWSARDGETIIKSYAGPLAKAEALYQTQKTIPEVFDADLNPDAPQAIVEITMPDPDKQDTGVSAVWEVKPERIWKDIRSHSYFTQSEVLASDIARCDRCIENGTGYNFAGAGIPEVMKRYYAMRMAGIEQYPEDAIKITQTIQCWVESPIEINWAGIHQVTTIEAINPPNKILGKLKLLPKIASWLSVDPPTPEWTTGAWEWIKETPEARFEGLKMAIIYAWIGAERWSKVLYNGSWDPGENL